MTLSLTAKKRLAITEICRSLLSRSRITVRDLAAVLGLLSRSSTAASFAQSHFRGIQRQYNPALFNNAGDMRSRLILSQESRLELDWWVRNVQTISGRSLQEQPPS